MSHAPNPVKRVMQALANGLSMALVSPFAATCWVERALTARRQHFFYVWSHSMSLAPGWPGMYLRRAFYRLTIDECASSYYIGFGAIFSHPNVRVASGAYIGSYALLGSVSLGEGCLIGSRVSILSGPDLHDVDNDGNWTAADLTKIRQISVGHHAWIGEGAIVMADVGARAMVAAGAVVSSPVPAGVVVAGNPARFVRRITPPASAVQPAVAETPAVSP